MNRGFISLLGIFLAGASAPPARAQDGLPLQVRGDLLKQEIFNAVDAKRYKSVPALIERYYRLGVSRPPVIYMIDARVSLQNGDPQRAAQALDAYLKRASPQDEYYAEAVALYPKVKQAIAAAEAAEKANMEAERAASLALLRSLKPKPFHFPPTLIDRSVTPQTALTRIDIFLKKWPESFYANSARAEALARLKRYPEAVLAYEKAIELTHASDSEYPPVYLSRALADGIGTPQSKTADIARYVRLQPTRYLPIGAKTVLNGFPRSVDAIASIYTEKLAKAPTDIKLLAARADFYELMDKRELAVADYSKLMELEPIGPRKSWHQFTRCRLRAEANVQIAGAIADCNSYISNEEKPYALHYRVRALAQLRGSNFARAISDYDTALLTMSPLDIDRSEVLFGRGIAKLRMGDTDGGQADVIASDAIEKGIGRKKFAELGITL